MEKQSIYGLTNEELINWFIENSKKKLRAAQVWEWLYQKRVSNFTEMTESIETIDRKIIGAFYHQSSKTDGRPRSFGWYSKIFV